jgi:hypothetical protein
LPRMYRYGDGTPFPLDENFIETLTSAVQACTAAFKPLTELDTRRDKARESRREAEREGQRLAELDKAITAAIAPFAAANDKKLVQGLAQKIGAAAKQAIVAAKQQVDAQVSKYESAASPQTAAAAVLRGLSTFFADHQLPNSRWIMSWDVRGVEPVANAISSAGKINASFTLAVDNWRQPIRVDQLAEAVVVHMMKRGVFGKAKPAPVELGKYVVVAFERTTSEQVITLKESPNKQSPGLRFAVTRDGATWVSISATGDSEGEANPLDMEDVDGVRRLAEAANKTLEPLVKQRTLVELSLGNLSINELPDPKAVPLELLAQLTPLARSIREKSRMSGELVLKKDVGGNKREELFVPRATLAQQFMGLPDEYRKPFEDMGISSEDTQPAIAIPKPPARPSPALFPENEATVDVDKE